MADAYTGPTLVAGIHSFTASATDLAGNPGSASTAHGVNTAITPPAFTSISSDTGNSSTDRLTSGGTTTFAKIGLGTNNSWASMTISGAKLSVTATLSNGWQATAGRGGLIYLTGGELAVTGTVHGLVMSRNSGSNANNISKLHITGGTANLAKLTLGYDSSVTAGSATVSLTDGELNPGAGGIVKNGTVGLSSTITLNRGTLGALAN